jgi:hypothetical protein
MACVHVLLIVLSWSWCVLDSDTLCLWQQVPDCGKFLIMVYSFTSCPWFLCSWLSHVLDYSVYLFSTRSSLRCVLITVRSWIQSVPDYSLLLIAAYSWLWIMCSCLQHATDNWVFLVMACSWVLQVRDYGLLKLTACSCLRRVRAYGVFLLIVCSWVWHVFI